jgi:glycosyltransferase involved in cell wall biosynthesis
MSKPLVTAVIPTRNRPELVCRAVRSALAQTYANLEVVVVIDGPDPSTVQALEALNEPRLRIVALEENVGGSEARNIGVREAKGEWIAFLDDDDEWLPQKVQRQVAFANSLRDKNAIVACRFIDNSLGADQISPIRLPGKGERIDEYFFCPKSFRTGEGFLQTSTLLVHRELLLRVPFVRGIKRGQEVSWMLRACSLGKAGYYVLPEVLSFFHCDSGATVSRVSANPKWRSFYEWMKVNKTCFTPLTYSFCIATSVLPDAITCKETFSVKLRLLWACVRDGAPTYKCILKFCYALSIPLSLRLIVSSNIRRGTGKITPSCYSTKGFSS